MNDFFKWDREELVILMGMAAIGYGVLIQSEYVPTLVEDMSHHVGTDTFTDTVIKMQDVAAALVEDLADEMENLPNFWLSEN